MASTTMTTSIPRVSGALGRAAPPAGGLQTAKPFLAAGRLGRQTVSRRAHVVAQARPTSEGTSFDFDSWLSGLADKARPRCVSIRALFAGMTPYGLEANKFENSQNKPAIVGYSAAALGAFVFAEWLIHLPGLNLILGFPLETAAVLLLPYFGVKYFIDKDSVSEDISAAVNRVTKELPGLGK